MQRVSGRYGVLRPYDRIQPYRLEMATKLKVPGHAGGLAEYWRDTLTEHLRAMQVDTVINCASQESAQRRKGGSGSRFSL